MIKSIEVKVYQDRLYCDECGDAQDDTYQIDIKVIRPIDSINFTCVLADIKDVTED